MKVIPALTLATLALLQQISCFGAGNVPETSQLNTKVFRHGDIEDTLMKITRDRNPNSVWNFFKTIFSKGKISPFEEKDVRLVYFGNWLRDYSQILDKGALQKIDKQLAITLVKYLGFGEFAYGTREYEVTEEKLGCYRAEEHIDNPFGYPDDAQTFHPCLRGPVDPKELLVDPRTGLKNYIANDGGTWMTTSKYLRRLMNEIITEGRKWHHEGNTEAGRQFKMKLGRALHSLEDFYSHSNTIELTLHEFGYTFEQVFPFVGKNTQIPLNGKRVYPLVTGTFGGVDFLGSVLGELQDGFGVKPFSNDIKPITTTGLNNVPGYQSALMKRSVLPTKNAPAQYKQNVTEFEEIFNNAQKQQQMAQQSDSDLRKVMNSDFSLHDTIKRPISAVGHTLGFIVPDAIKKYPGQVSNSISAYIWTVLKTVGYEKFLSFMYWSVAKIQKGMLVVATSQSEIFDSNDSTDPTHTRLSKDHFNHPLNKLAAECSIQMLTVVIPAIFETIENKNAPIDNAINVALGTLVHPANADTSTVGKTVKKYIQDWAKVNQRTIQMLSKEKMRAFSHDGYNAGAHVEEAPTTPPSKPVDNMVGYFQGLYSKPNAAKVETSKPVQQQQQQQQQTTTAITPTLSSVIPASLQNHFNGLMSKFGF